MIKRDLIDRFIQFLEVTLKKWWIIMMKQEHFFILITAVIMFLLFIWLIHRFENREAREAIYKNFPFFEEAVNSFKIKIDYLATRVNALEERIKKIENKIK